MSTEHTIQWAEYKKEGGLLLVSIIFSAAMLIYLWADFQEKQQEKLRLNQLHDELVFDIDQAVKDKTLLNEIGASFKKLKAQGFYGEEDRLALVETLTNTADSLKLPSFKYAISPQVQIQTVGLDFSTQLALMESVVSVEAELLHEGDFVQLGRNLSAFSEGAYLLKSCELTREKTLQLVEITKNVALSCSFAFYTITQTPLSDEIEHDDIIDLEGG